MKIKVEEDIKKLYYVKANYNYGKYWWQKGKKVFVRIPKYNKDNSLGSGLYCCNKGNAILFKDYQKAVDFMNHYKSIGEIGVMDFSKKVNLRYIENKKLVKESIFGLECYLIENDN